MSVSSVRVYTFSNQVIRNLYNCTPLVAESVRLNQVNAKQK